MESLPACLAAPLTEFVLISRLAKNKDTLLATRYRAPVAFVLVKSGYTEALN